MIAEPLQQWTDRMGITHRVRPAHDLSARERELLNVLRQQTRLSALVLEAGYHAPAISQASPNMLRLMLRILLPQVADEEIATFDSSVGDALLSHWWAITDATLLSI
jgi:hypothetical protein